MDINNQKLIYFYCPKGSWKQVNKNLKFHGLEQDKKILNTYPRDLAYEISHNSYMKTYKDFDVICFDLFYDFIYNSPDCFKDGCEAIMKLIANGKQVVMSDNKKVEELKKYLPEEMSEQIVAYDLKYDLDN